MLDELQQQYLVTLPGRIDELKTLGRALRYGDPEAVTLLRKVAHSLHGSGATFGFPQISDAARAAEHASPEQLTQKIVELIQVLQQAGNTKGSRSSATVDILLIDDDQSIATGLQQALDAISPRFRLTSATKAAQAEELLVRQKYSLVLLDLVLPDRDGRYLLKEIKQDFNLDCPVYVISAIDRELIRAECIGLGAEKFILKPFDISALVNTIDKLLKKPAKQELSLVPMGQELPQETKAAPAQPKSTAVGGKTILIAEDDPMQANLIRQRLQKEGIVVDSVANGDDAVSSMRNKPYAAFILDVNMPGRNGFDVLQKIRNDAVMKTTPVIMLTAMGSESDIIRAYDLGADDYILKPFSVIQLVARVKSLLKKAH